MVASQNPNIVIGVVGGAASGKDTVAEIFTEYGFEHISSSDYVRAEITDRGLTPTRSLQTAIANEMRTNKGNGYWVQRAILGSEGAEEVVISGLYAPGEGEYIHKVCGGHIVGVVAALDPEEDLVTRYRRLADRADGSRDDLSYEDFLVAHARENAGHGSNETNIGELFELADHVIVNNGPLFIVRQQVKAVVESMRGNL